jgi:hypothetical protein
MLSPDRTRLTLFSRPLTLHGYQFGDFRSQLRKVLFLATVFSQLFVNGDDPAGEFIGASHRRVFIKLRARATNLMFSPKLLTSSAKNQYPVWIRRIAAWPSDARS